MLFVSKHSSRVIEEKSRLFQPCFHKIGDWLPIAVFRIKGTKAKECLLSQSLLGSKKVYLELTGCHFGLDLELLGLCNQNIRA